MSESYYRPADATFGRQSWGLDPRVPIIAQMAATIFTEKAYSMSNKEARRLAISEAFLLYGEIVVRLATVEKITEEGQ